MKKKCKGIVLLIITIALLYFAFQKYQEAQEYHAWTEVHNRAISTFMQKAQELRLKDVSLHSYDGYRTTNTEFNYSDLSCSNLEECISDLSELWSLKNQLTTKEIYEGKECWILIRDIICGEDVYTRRDGKLYKNGEYIRECSSSIEESQESSTHNNQSTHKKTNSSKTIGNKNYSYDKEYDDPDDYAEDNWEEYSDDYEDGYEEAYDDWE
ncbi:MAG: hypothetical protein Q4E53_05810 [Eubacteriales bacterium]|nr:hypothetical protein [Eubacteriales bacterium]